jgi:YHS domain-containing protein
MKTKIKILAFSIIVLVTSLSCNNQKKEIKNEVQKEAVTIQENSTEVKKEAELKSSLVCFVNNKFMGINQIPVEFEGKTYYGCCQDCVAKIKTQREVRYAKDPLTGAEVDKALAYIVISPQGNNDVLYFESEQNYLIYLK